MALGPEQVHGSAPLQGAGLVIALGVEQARELVDGETVAAGGIDEDSLGDGDAGGGFRDIGCGLGRHDDRAVAVGVDRDGLTCRAR